MKVKMLAAIGAAMVAIAVAGSGALAQTAPAPATQSAVNVTYIHAGRLMAVPGEAVRGTSTIIVRDGADRG